MHFSSPQLLLEHCSIFQLIVLVINSTVFNHTASLFNLDTVDSCCRDCVCYLPITNIQAHGVGNKLVKVVEHSDIPSGGDVAKIEIIRE